MKEQKVYDGTVIEYIIDEWYSGSRKALAKDLEVTEGLICHWIKGRRRPSSRLAYRMEDLTSIPTSTILFPHMLLETPVRKSRL